MSDYLGHLLERSFAPTPEVRPQVPSLFEPKPAGEQTTLPLGSFESGRVATAEKLQTRISAEYRDRPQPARSDENELRDAAAEKTSAVKRSSDATQDSSRRSTPEIPARVTEAVPFSPISPPLSPFPVPPERRALPVVAESLNPKANSKPAAVDTRSAAEPIVDFRIEEPTRQYGDRRPPSFSISHHQPHEKPETPHTLQPRNESAASVSHERAVKTTAALPLITASFRERGSERKESTAMSAVMPPSIHVTIGRVEIRATPPPAGPRSVQRKESGLSLENYLQRRAGGQS